MYTPSKYWRTGKAQKPELSTIRKQNPKTQKRTGRSELNYRWLRTEAGFLFADKQDRLANGDVDDHRIPKGGTPGWTVLNINVGYSLSFRLDLTVGLQNLFNEAYRIHESGVDGYGSSFWVGVNVRL